MKIAMIMVLAATATVAMAAPTTYPNKTSFLSSIRGNAFTDGIYGTPTVATLAGPVTRTSNGWSVSVAASSPSPVALFTVPRGIGSNFGGAVTLNVSTGGRPATAASMSLTVFTFGPNPVAGPMTVTTSAGESFNLNVPVDGQYLGFTTTLPFTSFSLEAPGNFEGIEDIVIGDAADMPNPDNCVGAVTVYTGTTNFTNLYTGGDLFGWRVPGNSAFSAGRDIWFRWTAPDSGSLNINTIGANFDTTLALYASNTCPDAATTATAFNDDAVGLQSRIITNVVGGQHYFIRVGGFGSTPRTGSGPLNIVFTANCPSDFNNDGVVDLFDYLDFVASFASGC